MSYCKLAMVLHLVKLFLVSVYFLEVHCLSWVDNDVDRIFASSRDRKIVDDVKWHVAEEKNEIEREDFLNFLERKRDPSYGLSQIPGNGRIVGSFRTSPRGRCSCHLDYQRLDLGSNYYPRYLLSGICKTGTCGPYYSCKEKKYKVTVLKLRDIDDEETNRNGKLPKPLRDLWTTEMINVAVGCECVADVLK